MNRSDLRGWLKSTKVAPSARFVYLALSLHADQSGRAWPSTSTIAAETGHALSTVRLALRELEAAGDVTAEPRSGQSTVYRLCPHTPPTIGGVSRVRPRRLPVTSPPITGGTPPTIGARSNYKKDVLKERVVTSSPNTNGSAATPLRGGGTECTNCRKPIVFATLRGGRIVALDPEPDPSGLYALLDGNRAVQLGVYQTAAVDSDTRARLRRRHDDVCEHVSSLADVLDATRVNTWREQTRARKLHRDTGR